MRWERREIFWTLAILLLGGVLRFVRLGVPPSLVFDELYYARDACLYTGLGQEACGTPSAVEQSWVHPPLGKWLIAGGIKVFGYDAFGWRAAAALAGTALVLVVILIARRLFRDRWVAGAAGFLVAGDFLLIVQSRIAMLDILLAFFVALGFYFLVLDREQSIALEEHVRLPFPGDRPSLRAEWRFLAGAAFGLALAVKWSAVWALLGAGLLAMAADWHLTGMAGAAEGMLARLRAMIPKIGRIALALVILPIIVYAASYLVWMIDNGFNPAEFLRLQSRMLDFHVSLDRKHNYQSAAWTWPLVIRPVAYYFESEPSTHILAFGNPATWWASIGAAAYLVVRSLRRGRAERFVLVALAAQYLVWVPVDRPAIFFFYMTPMVGFMMIGLAAALGRLREAGRAGGRTTERAARWVVRGYLAVVTLLLVYFYPVIAAVGLPSEQWRSRMWFGSWI